MSKVSPDCLLESIHYLKNDAFCLHGTFNKTDQKYFYVYDLSEISFSRDKAVFSEQYNNSINTPEISIFTYMYIYTYIYVYYLYVFLYIFPHENIKEYILGIKKLPLY